MPKLSAPVRSFFFLGLLGAFLITMAMVVRSGILARKNPGRPINSTMRAAMNENAPQLSTTDALLIAETYGTAKKLPSGLRYIQRKLGAGDAPPRLGGEVIVHYEGRLLNVHPSLLPAFAGLHTHRRALRAGCKAVGATVHLVTAELDHGPIVMQSVVPVRPGDDEQSLAARVLATEHVIYPLSVQWFVTGKLRLVDGRVVQVDGASQVLM
jgi:hypothetical protein